MLSLIRGWLGMSGPGERLLSCWPMFGTARPAGILWWRSQQGCVELQHVGSGFLQAKWARSGRGGWCLRWVHKKPQKLEESSNLGRALQNTLGCFPQEWFAVASGHHTRLELGTETTVCLIWDKFKLEMRRFFLISDQITGNIVKISYLGDFVVCGTTRIILSPLKYWLPVTWPAAIKQWETWKNKQKSQLREFGN